MSVPRLLAAVLLALALLTAAPVATGRAQPEGKTLQINSVSGDGWPVIQATVTVLGEDGQPVEALDAGAFSAAIADQAVPVSSVATTTDSQLGIAVVLTFDTSGSMAGAPLQSAKEAGASLLAQLGPQDQAAVVSFSDSVSVVQGFTADRGLLEQAINGLVAVGSTALYSGVAQSIDTANQAPLPRRAIVLLSDGEDFGQLSDVDAPTTLSLAANSDALLFAIGLGADIDRDYLTQLAQAGRGKFLEAPSPGDLASLYSEAGQLLRPRYVLTLDASQARLAAGGQPLTISAGQASGTSVINIPQSAANAVPATVAATPELQPAQPAVQQQPAAQESSSGFPVGVMVLGLAAVAVVIGGVVYLGRRRIIAVPAGAAPLRIIHSGERVEYPKISRAVTPSDSRAWVEGPEGADAHLGDAPLTIGFSSDCGLVLPNGAGKAGLARARIWQRDGRFMLHSVSRGGSVTIGGRAANWVVLEDGDEIMVDNCRVIFHLPA